jgi:subtilase family serine protease
MSFLLPLAFIQPAFLDSLVERNGNFYPQSSMAQPGRVWRAHTNVAFGRDIIPPSPEPQVYAAFIEGLTHGPSLSPNTPYDPQQVRSAYNISGNGAGSIVIIDAFGYANALGDFNHFANQWSLPTEPSSNATLSTNQVFQVIYLDSNGHVTNSPPSFDAGWSTEQSLDIEWAHSMAPSAKIILIETPSNDGSLFNAVTYAKTIPGVKQVSMSWGGGEFSGETSIDSAFATRSILFFAATGDIGAVVSYPATSPLVFACGGTTLTLNSSGGYGSETPWIDAGGGPSTVESRPSYQSNIAGIVGNFRGTPDFSCVADASSPGVYMYNSQADPTNNPGGWWRAGGTSLSTPLLAGIANQSTAFHRSSEFIFTYFNPANFNDISAGSISSTGHNFNAMTGWDFATGLGTPKTGSSL